MFPIDLSTPDVAEQLNMHPGAIVEPVLLAVRDEPLGFLGQSVSICPLRHEQHPVPVDFGKLPKVLLHLQTVRRSIDNEFDLVGVFLN